MVLADRVHIARRFQRAVRVDTDVEDTSALEGFFCPRSSTEVLLSMARHLSETGHAAFTWTGPYGSGKSSLVIALCALLSGKKKLTASAVKAIGEDASKTVLEAMPPKKSGWLTIPVIGQRDNPVLVIGEALVTGKHARRPRGGWTETKLIAKLEELAAQKKTTKGGVILFVDEMGKFLEGVAQGGGDIFLFQQLAEVASRSGGRFLIVGILHQAFEEYANRVSREQRDEWSKIQGRFIDLPVNVAGEEQLSLIARAIEKDGYNEKIEPVAKVVAGVVCKERSATSADFEEILSKCWPLHPVTACLLGPISRRRFGQNQRSIFGFLNSAESQGFQDFLRHASDDELYAPTRLWDYLRYNLEPSILASPDGHRWSIAVDAVQRCEALGGDDNALAVIKTIALIDMFRERSGLLANEDILHVTCGVQSITALRRTFRQLQDRSLIIYRKFSKSYAVFAGSDFDIESAVEAAFAEMSSLEFSSLREIADIQPILAKRHYHTTGALRWFDVDLVPVSELSDVADLYKPECGTIGQFILAIPMEGETKKMCQKMARDVSHLKNDWDIIVGISPRSWAIIDLARELWALEFVRANSQELAGDPVARREVNARIGDVQGSLEGELQKAFDNAEWYCKDGTPKSLFQAELNSLASDLADERFNRSPIIFNELLNRIKPSSSAAGAQRSLLHRMVKNEGDPRLGIEGFPAEGGLFESLLKDTGLYAADGDTLAFNKPQKNGEDKSNLHPLWEVATNHLKKNDDRAVPVSELYDIWREAPFGVRDGIMPILAVAYMLSCRQSMAFYCTGLFQDRLSDLEMDYLAKNAGDIQLRWMELSEQSRRLLSGMAEIVRDLDQSNTLTDLAPIDVARGLVAIFTALPPWTRKTMRLSKNALRIRQLLKNADDPNKFLFDELPESLTGDVDIGSESGVRRIVDAVREGLEELCEAYPTMLCRLRDSTLAELQVPNTSSRSLAELRERAQNVKDLMGDLRLDAFIGRLVEFDGSNERIEGLASLATSKPAQNWTDPDIDKAAIELADLAQKFVRAEAFARVKGRADKRHAMAVFVGVNGRPTPVSDEFDVTDRDRTEIDRLVDLFEEAIDGDERKRNVVLAALAELSARYLKTAKRDKTKKKDLHRNLFS